MANYINNEPAVAWEKVDYVKKQMNPKLKATIKVQLNSKNNQPKGLVIARDLTDKAEWKDGTRVTLYRSGSLFKLAYDLVGLETVKKKNKTSVTLSITGQGLSRQIYAFSQGATEFDAWVDGKDILFKKKGE